MSAASAQNLQAAAAVAAAVATKLSAAPGAALTAGSVADIFTTVLQVAGPTAAAMNPNVGLVLALAAIGLNAMHIAQTTGSGLSEAQFQAIKDADAAALAADAAAHPQGAPA